MQTSGFRCALCDDVVSPHPAPHRKRPVPTDSSDALATFALTVPVAAGGRDDDPTQLTFVAHMLSRRAYFQRYAEWPSAVSVEAITERLRDEVEVAAMTVREQHTIATLIGDDWALVIERAARGGQGMLRVRVCAPAMADADRVLGRLHQVAPASRALDGTRRMVRFWMGDASGGSPRAGELQVPVWADIAENYSDGTRAALATLMASRPASSGLHLWYGPPGTGKTTAIRALTHAWGEDCDVHVITDPEAFFAHPQYLLDVIRPRDGAGGHLIVLEDAGEFVARDAKVHHGQGLSRLLNITDGMLGEGMALQVLITTNEPVDALHEAARRPGRSTSRIEFAEFSEDEARAWCAARGRPDLANGRMSLAALYGACAADAPVAHERTRSFGFR